MNDSTNGGVLRQLSVQVAELKGAISTLQATLDAMRTRVAALEHNGREVRDKVDSLAEKLAQHGVLIYIISGVTTAVVIHIIKTWIGS